MIAIVTSKDCPAGRTIRTELLKLVEWEDAGSFDEHSVYAHKQLRLYTIRELHIHAEGLDRRIDADLFIFATTHKSRANVPALTVHAVGNWDIAEKGGQDRKLGIAPAPLIKRALQLLEEKRIAPYDVIQEATHHGPLLETPALFIEIGSTEKEYADENAGRIVAETILQTLESSLSTKTAVGIGGLHHTPNFRRIQLQSDVAVGHVIPKHMLQFLTTELLEQAMERTIPKAELVIVDWKGLGLEKERVRDALEGLEWMKVKDVER